MAALKCSVKLFFPMRSSTWWWICLATFPHVFFSSLCLTWTIHISYPPGNKSISHQTGRVTSSSSQKYCLGGDMIDPRRVYIVCAKIQAPPLFRHNSLIAHQRIPVMAGGMMMIPNVRSWSTLAHTYSIDPDDWTRGSEQMLHMWRVPAPCSWIFQRTPRKDPTPQLGLAGFVGFFPRCEVRGACSTGDLYKKWGMSPVALLIFVAPCRRENWKTTCFFLLDWEPICLSRMKVDLGTCGPVCKDISRRTWSLTDLT